MDVWVAGKRRCLDAGVSLWLQLQGMAKPRKRRQKQRGRESCSSSSSSGSGSSGDEMSTEDSPPAGSLDLRDIMMGIKAIRESQVKGAKETRRIRQMLEDDKKERKEDRRTQEEVKERIHGIEKHLKKLNVYIAPNSLSERPNYSSGGDISLAPRSELNQTQPPRFCLKITSEVNKKVETGKYIETNHGDFIEVNLYDGSKPIAPDHRLASARIMMVIIKGKFNKDDNRYNWSDKEFKENIIEPEGRNSATGDRKHGIESIVSNCTFYLASGSHRHSGVTIVNNSGNKRVRLGVMVLSHTEERVLEGLSNHFLVRDPPKKLNKQRKAHGNGQEQNGPSSPIIRTQKAGNGINIVPEQLPPTANMDNQLREDIQHSVQTIDNQQLCLVAEGNYQSTEGAHSLMIRNYSTSQPIPSPIGYSFLEHTHMFPVQLLWDRPFVEPTKRWNLLDQLMPLYSSQTKIHGGDFSAMRLMPQHYDSLTTYSEGLYQRLCFNEQASLLTNLMRDLKITTTRKHVMQTHQNRGVLIQPLEPDDPDDEAPLRRKLNKYQLQFVNKMCKDYYTWEKIKADDGNLVDIALYDESNMKITSGPLSSASVEVVVLYSDFNAAGQDYWDSEEFSSCIVCAQSENAMPVLGGHPVLVLVNGEASISNAFFQQTSRDTRTGKFKMGVMLTGTRVERVQEGISDPFSVWDHRERGNDLGIIAPQATPGQVATVIPHSRIKVELEVGWLIFKIMQVEEMARRKKRECKQAEMLPHLQDPEVMQLQNVLGSIDKLLDTLWEAKALVYVTALERKSAANQHTDKFRDVQSRLNSYLHAFPFIGGLTRYLDEFYNIRFPSMSSGGFMSQSQLFNNPMRPDDMDDTVTVSWGGSKYKSLLEAAEVAEDKAYYKYGAQEFSVVKLAMATNNFALDRVIGQGSFGTMYKGRLPDGWQAAIKRCCNWYRPLKKVEKEFQNEIRTLSSLRHKHIALLFGWSAQEKERFLVYEYMENGSLHDQLHRQPPSCSSLVTTSWRTRIEILLGVSRAIEYMHCHAVPRVIHRDIKSSNILLDESWMPHISNFGTSVTFDKADKDEEMIRRGTYGYMDPECYITGLLKPTSDLYDFGVVILEILTGMSPSILWGILWEEVVRDSIWLMESIQAGALEDVLDKCPEVPKPTPGQLEALALVARTAAKCLRRQGEDRPAISDVVAALEMAVELVRRGG